MSIGGVIVVVIGTLIVLGLLGWALSAFLDAYNSDI